MEPSYAILAVSQYLLTPYASEYTLHTDTEKMSNMP